MSNHHSKNTPSRARNFVQVLAAGMLCGTWAGAGAAISIPGRPLFLANDVQANIFFALDDSGSMDWNVMVPDTARNGQFEMGGLGAADAAKTTANSNCATGSVTGNDCYLWATPIRRFTDSTWAFAQVPSINMLIRIAASGNDPADAAPVATNDQNSLEDYSAEARAALASVWRIWNYRHNPMYYNPQVTYVPWNGTNISGVTYTNANPLAALRNPYDPAEGVALNLTSTAIYQHSDTFWQGRRWNNQSSGTGHGDTVTYVGTNEGVNNGFYPAMYTVWDDKNGNGVVDADRDGDGVLGETVATDWETPTVSIANGASLAAYGLVGTNTGNSFRVPVPVEIKAANAPFTTDGGLTNRAGRTDCVAGSCTYAQELQNFANWFQYYRSRELVLKRAVSDLILSSGERMGLATINNNGSTNKPVTDMLNATNKTLLLRELFEIESSSGTALRTLLSNVGHYYDKSDSGTSLHSALGFTNDSPILDASLGGECQQNFTLLFTDGFWNDATAPQIGGATNSDDNPDGDGNTAWDTLPGRDAHFDMLADVAMDFYERDLGPALGNFVAPNSADQNTAQHMVSYTVAFGLPGTLTDAQIPANHLAATPSPPWPLAVADTETTVDDLRHAAFNSRGLFLGASNPQQLIDSLTAVLRNIGDRLGVASAVAATSQSIQTGTLIFQGLFDTNNWDGRLFAKTIDDDGEIGEMPEWEASELIPVEAARSLWTWNGVAAGVEFRWTNLSAAQKLLVGTAQIANYIRGDRSLEGVGATALRQRDSLLGDIIDSTPVAVTKEQAPLPFDILPGEEGDEYLAFIQSKQTRQDMVYVGANDGVLHGIATNGGDAGEEIFGYIPQVVFPNLDDLAAQDYSHKYYVDGGLTAADAFLGGQWKSVLLGTTGRGGKAVFALNVSNPMSFNATHVLWEKSSTDAGFSELGTITGAPAIARIGNGATAQWVAIFGNGYNSTSDTAKLFIVNLATGAVLDVIDTDNLITNNGLATPLLVDTDGDFSVEYAYAGDLKGNMWKFDLTGDNAAAWKVAVFANAPGGKSPLYTALDNDGLAQPITARPAFAFNPKGGYNVLFGTGKMISTGDELVGTPAKVHTLYGINDRGVKVTSVGVRTLPGTAQPSGTLQPQEVFFQTDADLPQKVGVVTQRPINYATQFGWYLDLVIGGVRLGERVVADTRVLGSVALFTTFTPSGGCNVVSNSSAIFGIDALTGGRTNFNVFDINLDEQFSDDDRVTDASGNEQIVNRVEVAQTVAPITLIASGNGNVVYGLVSGLNSGNDADGNASGDIEVDDPGVYRLQPPRSTLGRQSWRQLQ